ncbi:hypothetical protein [Usitatibacter palustris]|uniref:PARP-type domain-containing protein n=1 Tax=Usitatibacter palustris TaxID=2732487 RepID=A0A6M4HAJ3_9PROT|nr:hypothetical protein [Usitatibacter palustris]QJR16670.1 hypothetical protein DSM104440_03506 [Usitatibacter palustris]
MTHTFEPAATGRSKCRGCGQAIAKGELRFGERVANPFADGDQTLWFHPLCAAFKRPESLLETLPAAPPDLIDREKLELEAHRGLVHKRLPRIDGAERAKGQAACRHCKEPIPKGQWRIKLVFFEEGRFNPSGFIHVRCGEAYFETPDIRERVMHFSPGLEGDPFAPD